MSTPIASTPIVVFKGRNGIYSVFLGHTPLPTPFSTLKDARLAAMAISQALYALGMGFNKVQTHHSAWNDTLQYLESLGDSAFASNAVKCGDEVIFPK